MYGRPEDRLEYPLPLPDRENDAAWQQYREELQPEAKEKSKACEEFYGARKCFGQEEYPNTSPAYFIPM